MPHVDSFTNLPIFKNEQEDDAALHLVRLHVHVCRLRVEFPEDCLMKLFMATLKIELGYGMKGYQKEAYVL